MDAREDKVGFDNLYELRIPTTTSTRGLYMKYPGMVMEFRKLALEMDRKTQVIDKNA